MNYTSSHIQSSSNLKYMLKQTKSHSRSIIQKNTGKHLNGGKAKQLSKMHSPPSTNKISTQQSSQSEKLENGESIYGTSAGYQPQPNPDSYLEPKTHNECRIWHSHRIAFNRRKSHANN